MLSVLSRAAKTSLARVPIAAAAPRLFSSEAVSLSEVVNSALAQNDLASESDRVLQLLSDARISNVKVANQLSDQDWTEIGVKVGERIIIKEALLEHTTTIPKVSRAYSRGGVMREHHQRSL